MQTLTRPVDRLLPALVALLLTVSGCAIQLVADYDSVALEEILATAKLVDKFYGTLLETAEAGRKYSAFAEQYVALEVEVQGMVTRNQARALNFESTEIARTILKLLTKYKEQHKLRDTYTNGNARLDRNRFVRLFAAASSAEEAKKVSSDDKDAEKESK